jgi:hypothetical protein
MQQKSGFPSGLLLQLQASWHDLQLVFPAAAGDLGRLAVPLLRRFGTVSADTWLTTANCTAVQW